jgi:hypothetical protein
LASLPVVGAHQRGKFLLHDADEGLARRQRADDFLAQRLFLHFGDEFAHGRQRDVGLEQGQAHFAQHLGGVRLGEAGLAAHRLDDLGKALCQVIQHRSTFCTDGHVENLLRVALPSRTASPAMLTVLLVQLRFSNGTAAARDGFSRCPDIYKWRRRAIRHFTPCQGTFSPVKTLFSHSQRARSTK